MKFTVGLLLLAVWVAAGQRPPSSSQASDGKTDKRALAEGNAGVGKRALALAAAPPPASPGVVYADTNQLTDGKSPQQEVFATPQPQLAKISDLLTGQEGQHFQAAIARHLFSPVSIYQTRIPGYEVSAPIPSKLAYAGKLTYQPQVTAQFTPQDFHQPQGPNVIRVAYPQPIQYQQIQPQFQQVQPQLQQIQPQFQQVQPQFQQVQPQLQQIQPQFQQVQPQFQQIQPQFQQVNQHQLLQASQIQPVQQYQEQQQQLVQIQPQQPATPIVYNQQPFQYQGPFVQLPLPATNVQPGIVYAREEDNNEKPVQELLKKAPLQREQQNLPEIPEQKYNAQKQEAISYASFSVGAPRAQPQTQNQQYPVQPQTIHHQQQLQPREQLTQQQYPSQPQPVANQQPPIQINLQQVQQRQLQLQNQRQYQIQRQPLTQLTQQAQAAQYQPQQQQIHLQIQPRIAQKPEPSSANSLSVSTKTVPLSSEKGPQNYFRVGPAYQPQGYQGTQGQQLLISNHLQQGVPVPTFPPVQFFELARGVGGQIHSESENKPGLLLSRKTATDTLQTNYVIGYVMLICNVVH